MPRRSLCCEAFLKVTLFPVFACEGQQGDVTGTLDSGGHFTLVFCARTGLAAWTDLTVIRDKALEKIYFFIIDRLLFIRTKLAELRTRVKAAL